MKKRYFSLGLAAMLALAGCGSSQNSTGTPLYKAGSYTGTGAGKNGDVQVTVEFTDDAIKSVTIGDNSETEAIAKPAFDQIPQEIVDAQSTQVDVVSGATLTSNAIIAAVNDCIVQAGGTVPTAAAEKTTAAKEEKSEATDVLVIGGGMAGMSAALAAKDAGADVTLLEAAGDLGGTVKVAGGYLICVDSELYKDSGADQSLASMEKAWKDHMSYSGADSGYPDWDRLDLVLSKTGETIDWLAEKGVRWDEAPFTAFDGGTYVCAHDVDNGPGLVSDLADALDTAGVKVELNTKATELTTSEDGAVTGAVAETKDAVITYSAKAVILATGGYANDPELLAKYAPKLAAVKTVSGAAATATGDGFRMAEKVSADFFEEGTGFGSLWATQVEPSALEKDRDLAGVDVSKALLVDGSGKRFAAEVPTVPYMDALASDMIQNGNGPFYFVFDSKDADAAAILEAGADLNAVKGGETVEDLAAAIGVDKTVLSDTILHYNDLCKAGEDTDFGKAAEYLSPLETGPYYALEYVPTTFGSTGGVKTDDQQHVLKADGSPIKGLYAAGEMSNRYFYNENYMLGGSLGLYSTCGRIAGTTAAAE